MKGKKGIQAETILPIFVIVALFIAVMMIARIEARYVDVSKNMEIGERQLELFKTYSEEQRLQVYSDLAAEKSTKKAKSEIGKTGGFGLKYNPDSAGYRLHAPCGTYQGFALWKNGENECYPHTSIVGKNYLDTTTSYLNQYFLNYKERPFQQEFEYEKKEGFLIGKATSRITVTRLNKQEAKETIIDSYKYTMNPSFKIKDDFDPGSIEELSAKIRELIDDCQIAPIFSECIKKHNGEPESDFIIDTECSGEPDDTLKAAKICASNGNMEYKLAIKLEHGTQGTASSDAETVKRWAIKYGVPEIIALQLAKTETGGTLMHRDETGNTIKGDGGCSIGIMQINTCAHPQCIGPIDYDAKSGDLCLGAKSCSNTDLEDVECNVEAGIRLLKGHYEEWLKSPIEECTCGTYSRWDYALRRYNGCACDNSYVEIVKSQDVSEYIV